MMRLLQRLAQTGERRHSVSGTPADCVRVALGKLEHDPEWVISGINRGGNVIVAIVVATSLVFGALSLGGVLAVLPAATFAILTTVAREMFKDVQDLPGDQLQRVKTFASVAGSDAAIWLATAILLCSAMLTPVPYLALGYSGLYLLLMLPTNGLLLSAAWAALGLDPPEGAGRASRRTKLAMVMGLVGLACAHLGPA